MDWYGGAEGHEVKFGILKKDCWICSRAVPALIERQGIPKGSSGLLLVKRMQLCGPWLSIVCKAYAKDIHPQDQDDRPLRSNILAAN